MDIETADVSELGDFETEMEMADEMDGDALLLFAEKEESVFGVGVGL